MSTPVRKEQLDGLAVGLLLACCLFWGFQQVLVKATLPEVPPVFQAGTRFIGATVLLWLWCRWRQVPLAGRDGTLVPGLVSGSLFAAEFACLYIGLQYTSASRLTLFLYTAPFWVALLLPWWVRAERLRTVQWLGLGLAFVALAATVRDSLLAPQLPRQWLGDALALAAGLAWGLTTLTIRASALARASAEKVLLYQVGVSAVALPLLSLSLGEAWWRPLSGFALGSLLLQTVVGAFASYLAWMWMLRHYPATRISAFVFLTPLFALLFGAGWLGEVVTPSLLVALAAVALGIALVNRRPG